MNGPRTHSFPTVGATIRAEILDATGPNRRSWRETVFVVLVMLGLPLFAVLALLLALTR